uniref:Uncharacterized protein n=1 Tax=Arundo donax TaxID=35708 RepID=A0A0A9B4D3_ARUDO
MQENGDGVSIPVHHAHLISILKQIPNGGSTDARSPHFITTILSKSKRDKYT